MKFLLPVHRRALSRAVTFALALSMGLVPVAPLQAAGPGAGNALPHLGDGSDMTAAAERRLGDRIARSLYRDPDYVDDPVIQDYVQGIWSPLMEAARVRGELPQLLDESFAWQILLGRDRSVNAFALPGGYLGIHLGLVAVVSSRDELASVMAHELSHVTQRHIARSLSRQADQAPWVLGAMILGMLAASKSPNAASAVVVGGQAAAMQTQLNFSRDMEREADRVGFGVMTQAGYAPQGFASMFEKLQQANRLNDSGAFPYLRSHPLTTERIADMQARLPAGTPAGAAPLGLEHAQIAARARVLSQGDVDSLRRWDDDLASAQWPTQPAASRAYTLYGATLAAMKQRDFGRAQALLTRLQALTQAEPDAERQTRLLGAELALAAGQAPAAASYLQGLQPVSRASQLLQARVDLATGRAAQAAQALQAMVTERAQDASAWQLLAQANAQLGRKVAAVRCEAEASIAQLDYAAAAGRLKAAQDLSRSGTLRTDLIEASIVDTRLRQVEQWQKDQAQER